MQSSESKSGKRRVPYLARAGGGFVFRRRYPLDVRPFVKGECYVKRLEARDFHAAKREVAEVVGDFNDLVDNLRAEHGLAQPYRFTRNDAAKLAARVPAMVLANDETDRRRGITLEELHAYRSAVEQHLQRATDAALTVDTSAVEPLAQVLIAQEGLRLSPVTPAYDELLRQLLEAQRSALALLAQRLQGHAVVTPPMPMVPGSRDDYDLFDRALEYWQKTCGPRPKTLHEARVAFKRLRDFSGANRISQLDGRTVVMFREHLQTKFRLKGASVRKLLALLRAVMSQLVSDQLLAANPLDGIRAPRLGDSVRIEAFSTEQLARILASPVYTEQLRPIRGSGEAAFWLPLMSLFTGARLEELGQLGLADVHVRNGLLVLDIRETEEQHVKTEESVRRVPVHRALRNLGFEAYVQWCLKQGASRLFPALKPDRFGVCTSGFSRWFGRYLDEVVGIEDPRWNFHSFRHTFKQAGRASGVSDSLLDALQGHSPGTVGGRYGQTQPEAVLSAAIEQIRIPGLDLTSVHWTPPTGDEPTRLTRVRASTPRADTEDTNA